MNRTAKLLIFGMLLILSLACEQTVSTATPENKSTSTPTTYSLKDLCPELRTVLPKDWHYVDSSSFDTAGDAGTECVVLYRFDIVPEAQGRNPISGVVYQLDNRRPPCIIPYKLTLPSGGCLCEHSCRVAMEDVLSGYEGKELIFRDFEGQLVTRASIFRWNPSVEPNGKYEALGHFVGDSVILEENAARVLIRQIERPQLASKTTHRAQGKNYYALDIPSPTQEIVFWQGEPKEVMLTPHPEKVVLAFYNHYTNPKEASLYFAEGKWAELGQCANAQCGCSVPRGEMRRVRVLSLSPANTDCSCDPSHQCENSCPDRATVKVTIACETQDCDVACQQTDVIWYLVRVGAQWKLNKMEWASE
ncbi:MAG: hypothetical protein U9O54_06370 [Chloroflexota bacterium]|nr:hypothetical protein [Chloroflexota bacterium]